MTIIRRTIYGHHTGLWKQQPGWWVLDLYRVRLEFIRSGVSEYERCPGCGGDLRDSWFDRSLCPCDGTDWGVMHQRCSNCGYADDCGFDNPGRGVSA